MLVGDVAGEWGTLSLAQRDLAGYPHHGRLEGKTRGLHAAAGAGDYPRLMCLDLVTCFVNIFFTSSKCRGGLLHTDSDDFSPHFLAPAHNL